MEWINKVLTNRLKRIFQAIIFGGKWIFEIPKPSNLPIYFSKTTRKVCFPQSII